MRKKCSFGWIALLSLVSAAMIFLFTACTSSSEDPPAAPAAEKSERPDTPMEPGEAPLHFYYQGNAYVYHGHLTYALPEGFAFVAEVTNVGNFPDEPNDFEGNADGYVYMIPGDDRAALFQWKDWDEDRNGKPPYLSMITEDTCDGSVIVSDAPMKAGEAPSYFHYQGKTYVYQGYFCDSPPEGFELVAEVTDIAFAALAPRDADGNISGCIYMKPDDDTNAYFQWNAWDEEANGQSPYLYFGKE